MKVRIVELDPSDAFYDSPEYIGKTGEFMPDEIPNSYPPGKDFQRGWFDGGPDYEVYFYAVKVEPIDN
jgi:hypothetical protein